MKFSELLNEYLLLRAEGPQIDSGYTDKEYYSRLDWLEKAMDELVHGSTDK